MVFRFVVAALAFLQASAFTVTTPKTRTPTCLNIYRNTMTRDEANYETALARGYGGYYNSNYLPSYSGYGYNNNRYYDRYYDYDRPYYGSTLTKAERKYENARRGYGGYHNDYYGGGGYGGYGYGYRPYNYNWNYRNGYYNDYYGPMRNTISRDEARYERQYNHGYRPPYDYYGGRHYDDYRGGRFPRYGYGSSNYYRHNYPSSSYGGEYGYGGSGYSRYNLPGSDMYIQPMTSLARENMAY